MFDSEFDERKYRRWRAAAVTFGFLSVGLLIWGLVMHNHATRLEDTIEIRSSFTGDANED
ncbi:MAG: hypothetical protein K2W95_03980 [Candidatus Obscuribacterales bacterium]|nr:hypothetical protein [Candidatus Obscuribacterales bacterium]